MTAAHRLKGVGWFASCVVVVLGFYLVSLQVAAERNKLEQVNRRVADAQRDIRALETEFDTRANLAQLEKWNGDTLALTAPVAGQFVVSEAQLASIDVTAGPAMGADGQPVRTAALLVPSLVGVSLQAAVVPPTPGPVAQPALQVAAAQVGPAQVGAFRPVAASMPLRSQPVRLQKVAVVTMPPVAAPRPVIATTPVAKASLLRAVAVANVRPQAVAMLDRKLLSDSTLGDILSGARQEASRRR